MSSLTRTSPFGLNTPKAGGEALASRAGTSDTSRRIVWKLKPALPSTRVPVDWLSPELAVVFQKHTTSEVVRRPLVFGMR
jgi:hypothetical protein